MTTKTEERVTIPVRGMTRASCVKPGGRGAMMDWWLERRNLFARFLEFISHGEVGRRCWAPLEEKSTDYSYSMFIRGMVFVAGGSAPEAVTSKHREERAMLADGIEGKRGTS